MKCAKDHDPGRRIGTHNEVSAFALFASLRCLQDRMKSAKEHDPDRGVGTHRIALMAAVAVILGTLTGPLRGDDAALPVSVPERETPVEFGRDIQPILKRNCVACHNGSEAEASLILESPESIRAWVRVCWLCSKAALKLTLR